VTESVAWPNRSRHCCSISCNRWAWAPCAFMPFMVKCATLIRDEFDSTKAPRLNKLCNSSYPEVEVNSSSRHENQLVRD
jgi:hypothetical protein